MKKKSEPRQYIPVIVEGKGFPAYMLPAARQKVKKPFVTAKHLGRDLNDSDPLEEAIIKLFKKAFDIDIKTCTEGEWAERITIKGGELKQWQSINNVRKDEEIINSRKRSIISIALSVLLLIGSGLLSVWFLP